MNSAEDVLTKAVSALMSRYLCVMTDLAGEDVGRAEHDEAIVRVRTALQDWHEHLKTR